jgi:hypothetical protein
MARETEKEGMSTGKKVAAGAAIGVAVPTAVGVAKKLLGNGDDGDERQGRSAGRSRRATTRSTSSTRRGASSRAKGRTKEQLYNQAKRLKIEGRSSMTKAQLERAISRAGS